MQQRNKMIRLATHHFFQMGKFLFPLYALLLTGEVLVSSRMFVQSCRMGALLSFQAIWWKPILPVMFYVAYAVAFFGILLYFMRFTMGGTKGVYTLRSLPTGAEGLAGSMLLAVLWAFLLLWAVQIVAVYVSYGVYHWETALYNLPGARVGTSKLGFSVLLPDSPWAPPANDLYLTFCARRFCKCFIRAICFLCCCRLLSSCCLLPLVFISPFRFMGGAGGRPYRLPPPGRASSPQPQWGKAAWGSGISALVSFWRLRLPIWRPVPCGCLGWLTGSAGKAFWIKMEGSK